jgi:hypothetical protein
MKIHPKIGFGVFSGTLAKPKAWESLHFICRLEFPSPFGKLRTESI